MAFPGHAPQRYEKMFGIAFYISRQWNWWTCRNNTDRLARLTASLSDLRNETRPICAMIDVCGPYYTKRVPGDRFKIGYDTRLYQRHPPTAANIRKQFETAWAMGARRFRCYGYDFAHWKIQRKFAPIGAKLQTGIHPGDPRWGALELAVRWVNQEARKVASGAGAGVE